MQNDQPQDEDQPKALMRTLGLTLASAFLWGVAHVWAGRRVTGALLAAAFAVMIAVLVVLATGFRHDLLELALQPEWLTGIIFGSIALAGVWVGVVVRSYTLVRPRALAAGPRVAAVSMVAVLCLAICAPFALAAHRTYVARDLINSTFADGDHNGKKIKKSDPWKDRPRLNVLLLGGDAGHNRVGVRTDSVTLASIDTHTGDTVMLGLPRNLERIQMPAGPAADRFPDGFTGEGPETPGLLNEIYEYAEEHPEITPGKPKGQRGPALLVPTVSQILGQPIDYYILVDMRGFAQLIDAMGGVYLKVPENITFGKYNEGTLQAGYRRLSGTQALWYGRSRTYSNDYVRMGRQKCLLRAIARQADPQKLLLRFNKLADAAKNTISTDLPRELLPALLKLSEKMKNGDAKINSLQFVPPLISTAHPDWALIRHRSAQAIADSGRTPVKTDPPATASTTTAKKNASNPAGAESDEPDTTKAVSLDATCPS
ncbi:LCP family protein [Actinocorallia longicatena]|uniref:Cell envelope-related transcriptional attenuator domain-containing protein n=1 Tax=Actinocorallia longicatena TaxID=111803 RepID=A0ABP6Q901_9ACTN